MSKYLAWVNNTLSNTRAYGQKCYKYLIFFYSLFSLLSHHFLLFSSFSFYLRVSDIKPLQPTSITFFSSHSRCFSLFLLASPHQLLDLMLISVAVLWFFFFFFNYYYCFAVIWYPVRQWVGWDGDGQINGGGLRWANSVVGGLTSDGRIGGGGF